MKRPDSIDKIKSKSAQDYIAYLEAIEYMASNKPILRAYSALSAKIEELTDDMERKHLNDSEEYFADHFKAVMKMAHGMNKLATSMSSLKKLDVGAAVTGTAEGSGNEDAAMENEPTLEDSVNQ